MPTKKKSDILIEFLANQGVDDIFIVYGAANGDLIDAFTRLKDKTKYTSFMHEQAAGFAAEAYYKVKNIPGVAIATSGPGGQNFVTPIANCFYDSVPCIFITGQVKTQFQKPSPSIRQIGFQETDIVDISKSVTKYCKMILPDDDFIQEIKKAYIETLSGRPGPVLLDIPMDVQKQVIEYDEKSIQKIQFQQNFDEQDIKKKIKSFLNDLALSERPVVLAGGGVRTSNAILEFQTLFKKLGIPCYPTWNAIDIVTSDFENYCGRVGTYGGAGRNFGIQNADLLLTIGSRLSGRITGGNVKSFSRTSKKYMVDIDEHNLVTEWQEVPFDVNIHSDAKLFLSLLNDETSNYTKSNSHKEWLKTCINWKLKYDPVKKDHYTDKSNNINPYAFIRELSKKLTKNDVIVTDCGGNVVITNQSFETKLGQRFFSNNGNSPMGYSFAASLGAALAKPKGNVVCIIGDGGMNMNIQELQTIVNYDIPVKVIILNNHIYGITKAYQKTNFEGRIEACGPVGYNPPNFIKIAQAYNIETLKINKLEEFDEIVDKFLSMNNAVILDVDCHEFHNYEPRIFGWNTPIEDMYPYIDREEFKSNMFIEPLEGWEKPIEPNKEVANKIESAE